MLLSCHLSRMDASVRPPDKRVQHSTSKALRRAGTARAGRVRVRDCGGAVRV